MQHSIPRISIKFLWPTASVTFARLCVDFLLFLVRSFSIAALDKHVYQSQYFLADIRGILFKLETVKLLEVTLGVNRSEFCVTYWYYHI